MKSHRDGHEVKDCLGKEYVKEVSRKEKGIDEIWAIARRKERLLALRELSRIPVRALPYDLVEMGSIDALAKLLEEEKPDIRLLINAAGFGKIGGSLDIGVEDTNRMIELNCRAAVDMTYICIPYMSEGSRIMEICSTAGFQPFQYLNVYALRVELFSKKIKVTAVCPYWIRDTEFIPVAENAGAVNVGKPGTESTGGGSAGAEKVTAVRAGKTSVEKASADAGKKIKHYPLSSRVHSVAVNSLAVSRLGLPVSTPGIVCTIHWIVAKVIPSELMMGIWAILRRV